MKLHRAFLGAALLAGAVALPAQEPPPAQVQVFEEAIDVRVVNVEALVTDGEGRRVRGLAAKDFRLLVDGQEVPIEYFAEVADGTSVTAPAEGAGAASPVPAGEEVGRSYLIYVDESFAVGSVRDEILKKLERDLTLLAASDRMAVLAFDGKKIEVLSGWTGDRATLAAALDQARRRPAGGTRSLAQHRKVRQDMDWVRENADSLDDGDATLNVVDLMLGTLSERVSPEARSQLGKAAAAAAGALRGFEAPPGRKVLLYLSGAWSMSVAPQLYGPMIEAANRLDYTVYPVDAAKSEAREVSALDALARRTGGRAAVSAKLEVFREVVAETGSYYWLGFTPAWKADDRRHPVVVEARRPDLKVRARSGFSDLSKRTENAMKAESVLLFGGAEQEHRLIVQLGEPQRAGRGQVEVPVTLGIPVESLALTPHGTGYAGELPLAVAAMDGKGRRAELPGSRLKVVLQTLPPAGTYARFQTLVKLRDTEQRLVFTIRDPLNGSALWGEASFKPARRKGGLGK